MTNAPILNQTLLSQPAQLLRAHVDFVARSADAYDEGYQAEVKRFATSLRTLFHDVLPFRSLMAQANGLQGNYISTVLPRDTVDLGKYGGLVRTAKLDGRPIYFAPLDGAWYGRWLSFSDWWNEPVFIDEQRAELTRRELIVAVADKAAGSKFDPNLSGIYALLSEHQTFGWIHTLGEATITNAERAAVRQIVHETLWTLMPTYRKLPKLETDPRLAAAVMKANERPSTLPLPPGHSRNGVCPCGSGNRYKFCHGAV